MKSLIFFCTKIKFYLSEIPLIFLLIVSIINNGSSSNPLKLYPLIIFCIFSIIFIGVYFFRAIQISFSEIRYIGRFSSHDSAIINSGKTIILQIKGRSTVDIDLFGNDGKPPLYCENDKSYTPIDINLFRGRFIGGEASVKKILGFFGANKEQSNKILTTQCRIELENVNISSQKQDKSFEIQIFIKNTV